MPKQKYTAYDVAAAVAALRRSAMGCWCANVYDLDSGGRTFGFKFNKPSGAVARDAGDALDEKDAESEKIMVLIESGMRIHRTKYERAKPEAPSKFTAKLRMHVKTKRLNDVRQLGKDRAVDFTFGGGDTECHIIVELYSQGNIVLTDKNYTVLTLLRTHRDDEKGVKILGNHQYPLDRFQGFRKYDRDDVASALSRGTIASEVGEAETSERVPATLREALCRAFGYSPSIAEHVCLTAGIDKGSGATLPFDESAHDERVDALTKAVVEIENWFEGVTTGEIVAKPFVYTKTDTKADGTDAIEVFDDFSPFDLKQNEGRPTKSFELPVGTDPVFAFDNAVDEYYMALEAQSGMLARRKAEAQALAKLEKSLKDQRNRVEQLEKEREKEEQRAVLIEYNHEAVDTALAAVNSALASGMSWVELEAMIKEERRMGNPVASLIKSLDFENNQITVTLANHLDELDESEEAEGKQKRVSVTLDLGLSAHANASMHFAAKKKHAEKFDKTMEAQSKAVAAAEARAKAAMEKASSGVKITRARQPLWFEKFHWFITSENCLVLQAKDATQAEMLIERYMLPGDAFVHADIAGAPVTIVKPPPGDFKAVPSYSLVQAGAAVMCRSSAWNSRAVTSAWCTASERVSKISPIAGDKLPPGIVHVTREDKQFLPHAQLIMAFGVMFMVSEKNAEAHKNDRLVRSDFNVLDDEDNDVQEISDDDNLSHADEDDDEGDTVEVEMKKVTLGDGADVDADAKDRVDKLAEFLDSGVGFAGDRGGGKTTDGGEDRPPVRLSSSEETDSPKPTPTKASAPRMSAKERKVQKKGKKKGGGKARSDDDDDDDFVDPLAELAAKKSSSRAPPQEPANNKPLPRGKAAKLKRAKAKYADQDDEDRELAMAFLGAGGKKGAKKKEIKAKEKFEERQQEKPSAPSAPTPAPAPYKRREAEKRAEAQKSKAEAEEEEDAEERSKTSLEDRLKLDAERREIVNRLVSAPLKDDEILYAMPVCAPLVASNALKYRMKLTPGSQKKGKATKLALDILIRAPFATPAERAALKAISEPDASTTLPGGVKVSYPPGALKAMHASKKNASGASKRGQKKR